VADDLLALLDRQAGVEAGSNLAEQVDGRLGQFENLRRLQGRHAALQLCLLGGNPVELGIELLIVQTTANVEGKGLSALTLERVKRPRQGDGLDDRDSPCSFALAPPAELLEDLARVAQPALDVRPHLRLDRVRPDRLAPTAPGEGTAFDELAITAIPAHLVASAGADVGQTVETAPDDAPQQVRLADVPGDRAVAGDRVLGCLPELGGDERRDRGGDDLVAPFLGLGASLVDPPSELLLASVDGVDHEVPDPTRSPHALRPLLALAAGADEAPISAVVGRHRERVKLARDPHTAPALDAEPLVDAAHDIGGGEIGPQERRVGLQVGRVLLARDAIAERDDAAAVATFSGGPLHPDRREMEELPPPVGRDDRLDSVAKLVGLTLDDADEADAEILEPPPDDEQVDLVAAEPIELEDVDLIDPACGSDAHEPTAGRSLGKRDGAAHAVVDEALDELDVGLSVQGPGELLGLGLDRLALALVLGADPLVGRDPADFCLDRHLDSCPRRPGRTRGRPRTTRSAAAIASRSGM
jgi:hypothetical protein